MRRVGIALIVFTILASGTVGAVAGAPATFSDPQNRFAVVVLDGYQPVASPPAPMVASYTSTQSLGAGYNVQIEDEAKDIGPHGTLDDLAPFVVKAAQGLANNETVPGPETIQQVMLGGHDARRYDTFTTFAGVHLRLSFVYTLIGTVSYTVTFNTRDRDFAALDGQRQAVLDSFTFLPGAQTPLPVIATATAAPTPSQVGDPNGQVSFTLPANFRVVGMNESLPGASLRIGTPLLSFTSATTPDENLTITSESFTPTGDPQELDTGVARLRAQLPLLSDRITMGTEPIQPVTLGGHEARSYDFFSTTPQYRAHGVQVITLVGTTVYYLTCIAPEANYDVLQQDLQSVVGSFAFPSGT